MKEIIDDLNKFRDDRDWKQFHTADNLAKSISIEAAELLECFQWASECSDINNVKEELADVMLYCLQLAEELDLDPKQIMKDKMIKNAIKYPVEKCKGSSQKYSELK